MDRSTISVGVGETPGPRLPCRNLSEIKGARWIRNRRFRSTGLTRYLVPQAEEESSGFAPIILAAGHFLTTQRRAHNQLTHGRALNRQGL